ncbi:hypothetical protein FB45DRAFT_955177 [Roridomyces roridus]|uniref:Uncharacterized protein n=1 Tax=Roridomyces roridus TaxID=1738132 RepID=A0AAD7AZ35_9AGAR|nr:hypothetical protein FB45DRAFT_955177 [Roridomyces roridus]
MFLSLNIAFYLSSTGTVIRASPYQSLLPELMLYRLAMVVEESVMYILSLLQHLHDHGLQYLQILLLATASHSLGFLIVISYRRARKWVRAHATNPVHWDPHSCILPCGIILVGLAPRSRWIPWLYYYILARYISLPSPQDIHQSIALSSRWFSAGTLPIILGPLALVIGAIGLRTAVDVLSQFLSLVGVATQLQMRRKLRASYVSRWLLHVCCTVPLNIHGVSVAVFILLEVSTTTTFLGPEQQQLLDQPVTFREFLGSAWDMWDILRVSRIGHGTWRTNQAEAFHKICCMFVNASKALNWAQKLTIFAPVVIIYGYIYIMPIARKIYLLARIEHWKFRRRQTMYRQMRLNNSVENRLAANN